MGQDIKTMLEELVNNPKGVSLEAMPPFITEGKQHNICIAIDHTNKTISISHHTNDVGETDKEKIRNPSNHSMITFPFGSLMWLAPRLDGCRHFLGVENGYENFGKNTSSADR